MYDHLSRYSKAVVDGESMWPSFYNQEEVVVAKARKLARFEAVVFYPPNGNQQKYIKRIIGLPGDTLLYKKGKLYINGTQMEDKFSSQTLDFTLEQICKVKQIPLNYYFVLGDNRQNSLDSRSFGLVTKEAIVGTVQE